MASPLSFLALCICAINARHHVGVGSQGTCRKVRIPPRYALGLPSRHLLQCKQWHARLHGPTGPCVPQVVPSEVLYARTLEHFSEEELVKLSVALGMINTWNRLCVPFQAIHPMPAAKAA